MMIVRRSLVVLAVVGMAACASSEQTARKFIERGDRAAASGKDEAAVIEYRNAVKADPDYEEAQRKLGESYVVVGKPSEAWAAYVKAVSIDPSDVAAQIGMGKLLLASGQYEEAKMRADTVLETDRASLDARLLEASALAEMEALGGDRTEAEAAFKAAVKMAPQSAPAHVAFARFLLAAERPAEAEAELRQALSAAPNDELVNRAMAAFCQAQGRVAAAEPYFRRAAAVPHQQLRSTLAFADYLSEARRYDEARRVLLKVTTDGSVPQTVRLRLAAIEYDTGSHDAAHAMLEQALKRGTTAEGLALEARFFAAEGRTTDALAAARSALDLDRRQAAAHWVVGTIAAREGRLSDAEHAFTEVLKIKPWNTGARVELARVKLAQGDAKAAADLSAAAGTSLDARLLLATARAAGGDLARARQELNDLARSYPASAIPLVTLADLELKQGDRARARALNAQAIAIEPASRDAKLQAARLALADGDQDGAEQLLTKVAAEDPASFDAQAMLGEVQAERGDLARALKTYQALADRYPQSGRARTAAGIVLQAAGRESDARKWFEDAMALDPKDAVAAAHLARIYLTDDAKVMVAVRLGQNAVDQLPDDAAAHDTLGRAYLRLGKADVAVREFERALLLDAREPTYRAHLEAAKKAAAAAAAQLAVSSTAWR